MNTICLEGNFDLVAHLCSGGRIHASSKLLAADDQEQVGLGAQRLNGINGSGELVLRIVGQVQLLVMDVLGTDAHNNFLANVSKNLRLQAQHIGQLNGSVLVLIAEGDVGVAILG